MFSSIFLFFLFSRSDKSFPSRERSGGPSGHATAAPEETGRWVFGHCQSASRACSHGIIHCRLSANTKFTFTHFIHRTIKPFAWNFYIFISRLILFFLFYYIFRLLFCLIFICPKFVIFELYFSAFYCCYVTVSEKKRSFENIFRWTNEIPFLLFTNVVRTIIGMQKYIDIDF